MMDNKDRMWIRFKKIRAFVDREGKEVFMNQKQIQKEMGKLIKAEGSFINKNLHVKTGGWQEKISRFVPEKLTNTLNTAFFKAFELIFEKGTGIIEKTYNREKKEQDYKINEYTAELRNNRKSIRTFGKKAAGSKNLNMALSTVEGVGMGVLGLGIPDIPVFLAVLLKSIYEIALTYGFDYDSEKEQIFILKMIEVSLSHEEELMQGNMELNSWIKTPEEFEISRTEQIRRTSDALSKELLYLKFVQGMPVVGIVGGLSDMVYQKKITDYAAMKYKRRFLEKKITA